MESTKPVAAARRSAFLLAVDVARLCFDGDARSTCPLVHADAARPCTSAGEGQ